MKKIVSLVLALVLTFSFTACFKSPVKDLPENEIVILYTNDVHCGVDEGITYASLAAIKKEYEENGKSVLLVDCGDSIQGGPIGTISEGEYIIDIMNRVGYDVATIGNHEFDYGVERLLELAEKAEFPYVAANFKSVDTRESVFKPYEIIEAAGVKIAFVGMVTPKTITSSAPVYFQNEEGEYIYSFDQGNNGQELYNTVQKAVSDAQEEGADYVIALSHLGIEAECSPWMSTEVIHATLGIDAMLDGHSHSVVKQEMVETWAGGKTLLTQTGTKLANIGQLVIKTDGTMEASLISEYENIDAETDAFIKNIQNEFKDELQRVVATSEVELTVNDPVTGARIIRNAETNLGDLCADAYRTIAGSDVAVVNGGGIRANIEKGDITYEEILNVHPFGNALCVVEATGQEIVDALEMGASAYPSEDGGFLQVSGLSYEINSKIPSGVVLSDEGMFEKVEGERRVQNVKINGEDVILDKVYTLASHDYMLKNGGDGYNMFMDNNLLLDSIMLDNQVLISYIMESLGGVVGDKYTDLYGEGRIVIK